MQIFIDKQDSGFIKPPSEEEVAQPNVPVTIDTHEKQPIKSGHTLGHVLIDLFIFSNIDN